MWYYSAFHAGIIKFIQSFSSPLLDNFFILVTMMGEEMFFMIAAVIIYWCIDKNLGYRLGFSYLSSVAVNTGVKDIFMTARPIGQPGIRSLRLETAGGYSFPSGHSQGAAVFWSSVMAAVKKRWMYILGSVLILLVAISRLYLGVHWPMDVIAGAAIGILWVILTNLMFNYAEKTGRKYIFLIFIIPMLVLLSVFMVPDYFKTAGTALAFFIGYLIEPKYIKYEVKASLPIQALKLVIGIGVLMLIRIFLNTLLMSLIGVSPEAAESNPTLPVMICDFFRYLVLGIWVTILAPLLFKKLFRGVPAGK